MADIIGIGGSVYDMMLILDTYPIEDTKGSGKEMKIQCGGPCAVAMVAAAKAGAKAAFIGGVGQDEYGAYIKETLSSFNVDISGMKTFPDKQSRLCLVMVNPNNASRTTVGVGGSASFAMRPEDVDESILDDAKYIHVDGSNTDVAEFLAKRAKAHNCKVAMDADVPSPIMDRLLPYATELIPSEQFVTTMMNEKDPEIAALLFYEKYKPEVLVVTLGKKGGIIYENGKISHYKAFEVNAIDTNGAGDIFHGAYLAARVKGMSVLDACTYASATSAIKCTRIGGATGTPYEPEVLQFLKEHQA